MLAVITSLKKIWKKAAVLGMVGFAVSLILTLSHVTAKGAFLSDALFTVGSLFLCAGLIGLVKNLGVFNSMKYGTKSLIRMFRGQKAVKPDDAMVGGYLEYIKSRPKDLDTPWLILYGFVLCVFSVLASIPFF